MSCSSKSGRGKKLRMNGVLMPPGQTQLARKPRVAYSSASDQTRLRGGVVRGISLTAHRRGRSDVDDVSARLFQQVRDRALGDVEGAGEVYGKDALPLLFADFLEAQGPPRSGGVDQNVEPAEGGHRNVDRTLHRAHAGHVALSSVGRPFRLADQRHGFFDGRLVQVDAEDLTALPGDLPCRGPAKARAGTGDEHDAILKASLLHACYP